MSSTKQLADKEVVLMVLPQYENKVKRLEVLLHNEAPVVTVLGKYNHGKSRLLNELIGLPCFAVADKRETIALQRAEHNGVVWLDAPGLDADVDQQDDQYAERALWVESDIRLMVHAAKEGELDASELDLFAQLELDCEQTQRQFVFVLTQIDQVADEQTLDQIMHQLRQQLGKVTIHPVSAERYRKGLDTEISLFVEKSGIPALTEHLAAVQKKVVSARHFEQKSYLTQLQKSLSQKQKHHHGQLEHYSEKAHAEEINFSKDLRRTLEKIAEDLSDIMQEPEVDHALDTDTIQDVFKVTAGKLERSRLQIAYSRACILIRSVLTQYGVVHLPKTGQVGAASLNTVMIAVLGISVKYRADLRRLFGKEEGRDRLYQDFKVHFDASENRVQLFSEIARQHAILEQVESASKVVQSWECN